MIFAHSGSVRFSHTPLCDNRTEVCAIFAHSPPRAEKRFSCPFFYRFFPDQETFQPLPFLRVFADPAPLKRSRRQNHIRRCVCSDPCHVDYPSASLQLLANGVQCRAGRDVHGSHDVGGLDLDPRRELPLARICPPPFLVGSDDQVHQHGLRLRRERVIACPHLVV